MAFEDEYEALRTSPLLSFAGPALLACLQTENAVTLGLLLLGSLGEEWSPETLACMIDFGVENPTAIFSVLASQQANLPFASSFFLCLSEEGKIELLFLLQAALDAFTTAEHHLMGTIPEADAACIRDALSEEELTTLLAGTLHQAFRVSDSVAACMSDEGFLSAFIAMFETAFDGLAVETVACLEEFARTHPHYTALVNAHAVEPATVDRTALAEISHDGISKIWGCMNDAEVEHSLEIFVNASSGQQ